MICCKSIVYLAASARRAPGDISQYLSTSVYVQEGKRNGWGRGMKLCSLLYVWKGTAVWTTCYSTWRPFFAVACWKRVRLLTPPAGEREQRSEGRRKTSTERDEGGISRGSWSWNSWRRKEISESDGEAEAIREAGMIVPRMRRSLYGIIPRVVTSSRIGRGNREKYSRSNVEIWPYALLLSRARIMNVISLVRGASPRKFRNGSCSQVCIRPRSRWVITCTFAFLLFAARNLILIPIFYKL